MAGHDLPGQVVDLPTQPGLDALGDGAVAVVSLAGGVGSRWTKGAGVVKALNPFCRLGGRHRSFIEVAPGQEPAREPRVRHAACRTSSPPAI